MKNNITKCFIIGAIIVQLANPVNATVIGGKDWRQLTETTGINVINIINEGVCDEVTGVCSGSFSGVDFSGWTWATGEEVGYMLIQAGITPPSFYFDLLTVIGDSDEPWASNFVDIDGPNGADGGLFFANRFITNAAAVNGYSRTRGGAPYDFTDPDHFFVPDVMDVEDTSLGNDHASGSWLYAQASSNSGMWLYQRIPEPSTYLLIGFGLIGMVCQRRSRSWLIGS